MSFSQRQGLKSIKNVIQIDSMDDDLRNSLWNILHELYWDNLPDPRGSYTTASETLLYQLFASIWRDYFKVRVDSMPRSWEYVHNELLSYFFRAEWNEVYDFIEFIANEETLIKGFDTKLHGEVLMDLCNVIFAREVAGYRFVSYLITPVTSEEEIDAIENALRNTQPMLPVQTHLQQALALLADRSAPDYRNSIKESISAVESISKMIAQMPKATLGPALSAVEKKIPLHATLKEGFHKLYGFTSDASGIRHALMDEPNLDIEDAKFMLVACSGFINYLLVKAAKVGISL